MKVYFTGREHRVRRRETILNPPNGIEFITKQPISEMKKDYELSNKKIGKKEKISRYLKFFTENNYIPQNKLIKNINEPTFMQKRDDVKFIYSAGHLIFNAFPFVVEIDNISTLTYYNLKLLKLFKPRIKNILKSKYCRGIICISSAARLGVINYFNDETITNKCIVIYPYSNYKISKRIKSEDTRFLFISSNFYLKGGKEVVNAFLKVNEKHTNTKLTLITKKGHIEPGMLTKINSNPNIKLVEAEMTKNELFEKYYSDTDVFVLPSYQDSFGLVYLEAISNSLPVIATNIYAIPEMVHDDKNGFLCDSPISYFKKDFTPNEEWWTKDITGYAREHEFKEVEEFLEQKMNTLIETPNLINEMSTESKKIYDEVFNEERRKNTLLRVLDEKSVDKFQRNYYTKDLTYSEFFMVLVKTVITYLVIAGIIVLSLYLFSRI